MQITWEADNSEFRGRKRVRRACSQCKRSKKRCAHTFEAFDTEEGSVYSPPVKRRDVQKSNSNTANGDGDGAPTISSGLRHASGVWVSKPVPRAPPRSSAKSSPCDGEDSNGQTSDDDRNQDQAEEHRFLGDMNPEAALLDQQDSLCKDTRRNNVGVFLGKKATEAPSSDDEEHDETVVQDDTECDRIQANVRRELQKYLNAIGAFNMPTASTQSVLIDIYFEKINPILPILDQSSFMHHFNLGTASRMLTQAICLVAAKDDEAIPHLQFHEDSPPLSSQAFCTKLYISLTASVNAELERDHMILARVFALMSLHCEGFQGADASSMHLVQSIHHSQSISLQITPTAEDRQAIPKQNLFWSLWSLDKLHASMDGRAIMMEDRDISVSKPSFRGKRKTSFQIFLEISEILAKVIDYYRPTAPPDTTGWEDHFPSFEDIIGEDVGSDLKPEILGVLELYYHCVAIVSHRSRPLENRAAPSTPSSIRQTLSTLRIQAILTDEFPSGLPPFPVVPYAVSLAMTVAYRHMRQSKIITHFNRAKANLETTCIMLERLGRIWWTARCFAKLGKRALRNVDEMQDKIANSNDEGVSNNKRKSKKQSLETTNPPAVPTPPVSRSPCNDPHLSNSNTGAVLTQSPPFLSDIQVQNPNNFLSPISANGTSISQDSSTVTNMHDPWFGQALIPGVFDDFDNLLGGYVDLAFPTNLWNSSLLEDGSSMHLSGNDGSHVT